MGAPRGKDDIYQAADIAYQALHELGRFRASPEEIRGKLLHLLRGLPAEEEFAALCLWSGRCVLLHKLDKDVRPRDADYRVPDFLCVVGYKGNQIPVLVEVKTSARETVRFTRGYCEGLERYSNLLGLPLLVAFKFSGFGRPLWSLFHFPKMRTPRGSYRVDMPDMMKHDLSGVLLGNFHVQLWEGTALSMTITKDRVLPDGSFDGTIRDTHWETKDGRRVDSAPLLLSLFILTADDVEIDEHPDRVVQRFKKISDEGAIAYWALAEALDLDRYRAGGQIDWRRVIDEHQFAFTMRDLKRQAQSASQHGLVRYVLNPIPHEMPPFLEAVR